MAEGDSDGSHTGAEYQQPYQCGKNSGVTAKIIRRMHYSIIPLSYDFFS